MASTQSLLISCLCGQARQAVQITPSILASSGRPEKTESLLPVSLCHCNTCRHCTGLLCASYIPISQPQSLDGLRAYVSSSHCTRYFCATCGCHVFRSQINAAQQDVGDDDILRQDPRSGADPLASWKVATGTIIGEGPQQGQKQGDEEVKFAYSDHHFVENTGDGGLSVWLPQIKSSLSGPSHLDTTLSSPGVPSSVQATCGCGSVRFLITHPDASSRLPRSNYADLLHPYQSTPAEHIVNPSDEKWWLCPRKGGSTVYLAGLCACRSCRLASGFEIQAWAFVSRSNIFVLDRSSAIASDDAMGKPLTFPLSPSQVSTYESSPGVLRDFCATCGATLFWHDRWRPDLIDVSAGLLSAPEGVRAEGLLEWHTGRVSFAENAELGRTGPMGRSARQLVDEIEAGLRQWGQKWQGH